MELKEKSKFNADASDILIGKSYYAPSVHCSYYATFQLMKVSVKEFVGMNYDEIDKYVTTHRCSEHKLIHQKILDTVYKFDKKEYSNLKRIINDLFQYRIESDYKNIEVNINNAEKARQYSRDIISYLEKNLHV